MIELNKQKEKEERFKELIELIDELDSGNTDWNYVIKTIELLKDFGCGNKTLTEFFSYLEKGCQETEDEIVLEEKK